MSTLSSVLAASSLQGGSFTEGGLKVPQPGLSFLALDPSPSHPWLSSWPLTLADPLELVAMGGVHLSICGDICLDCPSLGSVSPHV